MMFVSSLLAKTILMHCLFNQVEHIPYTYILYTYIIIINVICSVHYIYDDSKYTLNKCALFISNMYDGGSKVISRI